jgi:hypothetical protein
VPGALQYWDGSRWTPHVAPVIAPARPEPEKPVRDIPGGPAFVILLGVLMAALAVIGLAATHPKQTMQLLALVVTVLLIGLVVRIINWVQR